jgi:hypothetical protein
MLSSCHVWCAYIHSPLHRFSSSCLYTFYHKSLLLYRPLSLIRPLSLREFVITVSSVPPLHPKPTNQFLQVHHYTLFKSPARPQPPPSNIREPSQRVSSSAATPTKPVPGLYLWQFECDVLISCLVCLYTFAALAPLVFIPLSLSTKVNHTPLP